MVKKSEPKNLYVKNKTKKDILLSPKYDIVFHALFKKGNENITKALIRDITQRDYKIIEMDKNPYILDDYADSKNEILDLKVELDDGELCNIEIQLVNKTKFKDRMLEYWSRTYSNQLKRGDDYTELKRTILIAIVDFNIKEFKEELYHTKWQIREENNHELILTNSFELHIIEIGKALKILKRNDDDKIAQWMSFFNNPNSMEVKAMSEKNKDIGEAVEKLKVVSSDDMIREKLEREERARRDRVAELQYAREEGRLEAEERARRDRVAELQYAREEGRLEAEERARRDKVAELQYAREEGIERMVKAMLENNIEVEKIMKISGLTREKINELKNLD